MSVFENILFNKNHERIEAKSENTKSQNTGVNNSFVGIFILYSFCFNSLMHVMVDNWRYNQ